MNKSYRVDSEFNHELTEEENECTTQVEHTEEKQTNKTNSRKFSESKDSSHSDKRESDTDSRHKLLDKRGLGIDMENGSVC